MNILKYFKRKNPLEEILKQPSICNISPETNAWNKKALEYSRKQRETYQTPVYPISPETNAWNKKALEYAWKNR